MLQHQEPPGQGRRLWWLVLLGVVFVLVGLPVLVVGAAATGMGYTSADPASRRAQELVVGLVFGGGLISVTAGVVLVVLGLSWVSDKS